MSPASPSPPPRRRLLLIALLALLAAVLVLGPRQGSDPAASGPLLPPPRRVEIRRPAPVVVDAIPPGLARAYAEFGAAWDRGQPEPELDAEAAVHAGRARAMLARQPWRRGAGRPVGADGFMAAIPPPAWLGGGGRGSGRAQPGVELPPGEDPGRDPTRAVAVDGPGSAAFGLRRPSPTSGDTVKELIHPDAWIAIPFDPNRAGTRDLFLIDRSGGGYAVRVETGDASSVRLDGGLVVPGRCYRIDGAVRITALAGGVGIQVIPLAAAPVVWEGAAVPIAGDG